MYDEPCGDPGALRTGVLAVGPDVWEHLTGPEYPNRQYVHVHLVSTGEAGRCSLVFTDSPLVPSLRTGRRSPVEVDPEFGAQTDFWDLTPDRELPWDSGPKPLPRELPIHRTEAGWPHCGTCDGGGCPDCTDPA